MVRLVLLFTLLPAIELALLIEIGRRIGTLETIGLILVTGVVGAALARYQGLAVLRRARLELAGGQMPATALMDGVIILVAAALLVTPGVLTDAVGFLLLIPFTRAGIRALLARWLQRALRDGRARAVIVFDPPDRPTGPDL